MAFSGKNKVCEQCQNICKQWRQSVLHVCPNFVSTQKINARNKKMGTLEAGESSENRF